MQQESNWPLLTVSKSLFDAMAASKGSKGAAIAAAMEVEEVEGGAGDGAWGDDAELELEEDGTIKAAAGEEDAEVGEEEGGRGDSGVFARPALVSLRETVSFMS